MTLISSPSPLWSRHHRGLLKWDSAFDQEAVYRSSYTQHQKQSYRLPALQLPHFARSDGSSSEDRNNASSTGWSDRARPPFWLKRAWKHLYLMCILWFRSHPKHFSSFLCTHFICVFILFWNIWWGRRNRCHLEDFNVVNTLYFAAKAIRYTQEYLFKHLKSAICKNWPPVELIIHKFPGRSSG